ncbi:HNH endonuclease [Caulobacter segnis]|uniref:HNH endonuclease n=1 Tax=Caulobacter segnis TaxID=88688 RepID=UPI00240EB9AE|nr:HNH endonuclease [Caulobacter segnis]MDG2521206.1 HNH endonuclease [Caulobacter segnis]
MKAILDTKPESAYDDEIAGRYHFPSRYLGVMSRCVGDWVVFRRPRAGGEGIAYFAVGRVAGITPDTTTPGHHYAVIADFLAFDRPVPWRVDGKYAEAALRKITNVPQVGLFLRGKSVRELEEADFVAIIETGLSETSDPTNARMLGLDQRSVDEATWNLVNAPPEIPERGVVEMLVNRKVRDANFRRAVCRAYDDRCAVTGLKIVNGGGRSEVQAAHILPVADGGPDIVQNGIALSATAHWLFDRHLISIDVNMRLLVSHNKVPAELRQLFAPQAERILLPKDSRMWPSSSFVAAHRERFAGV